jgi:hypothetical protein
MSKKIYLEDHIVNPLFRVQHSGSKPDLNRLGFAYWHRPGDWGTVADYIAGPGRWGQVMWFPDANVAILPETAPVWDALWVAAQGSPNGSTVITGVVEKELEEWLNEPYRNKRRADDIRAAMDQGTWISKFPMRPSAPFFLATMGYTHLLGERRSLARPNPSGVTPVGTDANAKSATMDMIRKTIGERAVGLAKKGRKDAEKRGVIDISDEAHCLMVIVNALINRRHSVLLTADVDYIEIFFKAQWFFHTHYRAWLAARMIKDGQYGEPAMDFIDNAGYFDGPLTLYRRPTTHLDEVLPPAPEPVHVGVVYVAPDGRIHGIFFQFEPGMLDMLATRNTTDGRCTDLFGEANIHVDLGPLKLKMDGLYLGIGKDAVSTFKTNGIRVRLSRLDLEHSLNCYEMFEN